MTSREHEALPTSRSFSPELSAADALADDPSLDQSSLWGSGRDSPPPPWANPGEPGDAFDSGTQVCEEESGCRGRNGYVYPFKVKLEERYPVKDPASYTDFEKRYPPDRFGEEASDNARVWKLYRDRVTERDEDQIEGWNKTLDILLIFAGLFSAVATAFIIEAYKQLQPDYGEILAKAFIASLNGTAIPELASFSHFNRPALARGVNTLWFLSLTLALIVALLAILAKQWLGEYTSRMRRHIGSQRRWAWRHLAYYAGLEKWGMDAFISMLPLMLHLSLLLFLIGLVAFLTDLDWVIVAFVLPLTATVIVFYIGAIVAPLWFGDCPTATPILRQGRRALELLQNHVRRCLLSVRDSIRLRLTFQSWREIPFTPAVWKPPVYHEEILLDGSEARRDAMVLHWMITSLPAAEEIDVALDAVGSLDPLEHRHEFHQRLTELDGGALADSDILCSGSVSIAAANRFKRWCEDGSVSDAATFARCIRTLLALSIDRLRRLQLPPSLSRAAHDLLSRWAAVPTHDLHLLCGSVLSTSMSQCLNIRDAVLAWMDDRDPETSETPFLSSSIALSFLRCEPYQSEEAIAMALIYSALSGALVSSNLESTRRRAASTILHRAVSITMHDLIAEYTPVELHCTMYTPQQLHLRAASTVAVLLGAALDQAPLHTRRTLAVNFAYLILNSPGAESLTLQHITYARSILSMVFDSGPERDVVAWEILKFAEEYLCGLDEWSDDASDMTRRLIQFYATSSSEIASQHLAAGVAFRLSRTHSNAPRSFQAFTRHSVVNLLLPGSCGEQSAWRTLCGTLPRGIPARNCVGLAALIVSYLTSFSRRGFDVVNLVEELIGEDRLSDLIMEDLLHWQTAHLAQHAKELSRDWWDGMKTRLLSLANSGDVEHADIWLPPIPGPLAIFTDGDLITTSSVLMGFVREVEALEACQACPDPYNFEQAAQETTSNQNGGQNLPQRHAVRQVRANIARTARRGRNLFSSAAEDHELPITAPPPLRPHMS